MANGGIKDGDIFFWRYKDCHDRAPWGKYHCKSQIAVARDGKLFDTFWSAPGDQHVLDPETVELTAKGNVNEMTEIHPSSVHYYDRSDLVDTRHSNHRRSPVYLRPGAQKSATAMRDYALARKEEAEREVKSAKLLVFRFEEILRHIEAGELDKVFF